MNKRIRQIIIKDYPSSIQVSKSRRPVYYVREGSSVKGKKNIPISYLNEDKYYFNENGVLFNKKTNQPQLANPRSVGKPRNWVVNFQDIWNQNITKQSRNNKVIILKEIFKPYIKEIEVIKTFPIKIVINIFDTIMPVDISNKGVIYTKIIEDLLQEMGKIPDDKVQFVKCSGCCKFVEVKDVKERKMMINIYKTDNKPE